MNTTKKEGRLMTMETFQHIKILWPILAAIGGFGLAVIYAIRFKLPDMNKRIGALEKVGAEKKDIDSAISSFHTVCRFNQVSCQKENQANTTKLFKELDKTLSKLHEKLNALALSNKGLGVQVELLLSDREHNANGH